MSNLKGNRAARETIKIPKLFIMNAAIQGIVESKRFLATGRICLIIVIALLLAPFASSDDIGDPVTFTAGTVISPTEMKNT